MMSNRCNPVLDNAYDGSIISLISRLAMIQTDTFAEKGSGMKKAVAMAAVNHQYWHEDLGLYTVEVIEEGTVETDEDGVCRLDDDDVTDRMEW